ncbi:exopolygalacturonase clone GBGE184 [Rutidosis leptorrhynchoides]|uniref:exopolygalacturonase clone GBGE184 n=1 Tax=Rutidosis leptorrhynchoides TaxID=125765 RepID=UPI003A99AD0D
MANTRRNASVTIIVILGLALLSCVSANGNRRALVNAGPPVFDITKFGAVPDDENEDNFGAFIKAWNAACHSGGPAKVLVPKKTYFTGPVLFQGPCNSTVTVEILGTIKATTDLSMYDSPEWFTFEHISGLTLTGGVFDGQGAAVWKFNDCKHNKRSCARLPSNVKINHVNNSVICGVSSVNSKQFHFHIFGSNNITMYNLNVTAPDESPNTDGIHLSTVQKVTIKDSIIGTGDDCISIGQGSQQISINNITCGPGHGISVGSLGKYKDEKDVVGVEVTNVRFINTTNGARIKTWGGSITGKATNITYKNVILESVKNPVIIDQHYGKKKSTTIKDIHFINFKGTTISEAAVSMLCSSKFPCQCVELVDIELSYVGLKKTLPFVSTCEHVKAKFSGKQNPPACKLQ